MAYLFGFKINKMDFIKKSVSVNRILLRICAIFSLLVELGNIIRVLFFSNSALGTLNNRIYFSFYLFSAVYCFVFLILDFWGKFSDKIRHWIYMVTSSVFLLWNTLFNIYDIHQSGAVGNFTIITAVVAFSSLLVMRPVYALGNLAVNYLLFVGFLYKCFSSGEVINFTITILLCATISFVRNKYLCIALSQEKELGDMHQQLSETRQSLRLSAEQHELIRKSGSYVTFQWDIDKDYIRFSKELTDWFDTPEEITHFETYIKDSKMISPESKSDLLTCMKNVKTSFDFQRQKLLLPMKSGENGWFEILAVAQNDFRGRPALVIGMLADITAQEKKLNRLKEDIRLDLFTGVYNKMEIERYGQRTLKELPAEKMLAAFILDIDDFKDINDNYGHPVGDYVLRSIADLMQKEAPEGARVGRIGGDEFLALLETNDVSTFYDYARKLISKTSEIKWQGKEIEASCSIGLSAAYSNASYSELYKKADDALHQAKRSGKKQLVSYGIEIDKPQELVETAVQ